MLQITKSHWFYFGADSKCHLPVNLFRLGCLQRVSVMFACVQHSFHILLFGFINFLLKFGFSMCCRSCYSSMFVCLFFTTIRSSYDLFFALIFFLFAQHVHFTFAQTIFWHICATTLLSCVHRKNFITWASVRHEFLLKIALGENSF